MKTLAPALLLLLATATAHAAPLPGDAARGKALHDKNCVACHDTSVYTRSDRHIQSLAALTEQVNGCSHRTGLKLSAAQINDLVKYLDQAFYKFK